MEDTTTNRPQFATNLETELQSLNKTAIKWDKHFTQELQSKWFFQLQLLSDYNSY